VTAVGLVSIMVMCVFLPNMAVQVVGCVTGSLWVQWSWVSPLGVRQASISQLKGGSW